MKPCFILPMKSYFSVSSTLYLLIPLKLFHKIYKKHNGTSALALCGKKNTQKHKIPRDPAAILFDAIRSTKAFDNCVYITCNISSHLSKPLPEPMLTTQYTSSKLYGKAVHTCAGAMIIQARSRMCVIIICTMNAHIFLLELYTEKKLLYHSTYIWVLKYISW